jgi:hypothetical protein
VYISLGAAALLRGFHSCECLMMAACRPMTDIATELTSRP